METLNNSGDVVGGVYDGAPVVAGGAAGVAGGEGAPVAPVAPSGVVASAPLVSAWRVYVDGLSGFNADSEFRPQLQGHDDMLIYFRADKDGKKAKNSRVVYAPKLSGEEFLSLWQSDEGKAFLRSALEGLRFEAVSKLVREGSDEAVQGLALDATAFDWFALVRGALESASRENAFSKKRVKDWWQNIGAVAYGSAILAKNPDVSEASILSSVARVGSVFESLAGSGWADTLLDSAIKSLAVKVLDLPSASEGIGAEVVPVLRSRLAGLSSDVLAI